MTTLTAIRNVAEITVDPGTLLVAFASQEGDIVDQHFGSAQAFYLYSVNADHAELVAHQSFGYEKKDGNEDKLKPKLLWLAGADVVYCGSIGGSAARQLVSLGVNPLKVEGGPDVEELLAALQTQLRGTPEAWLTNILRRKQQDRSDNRFDAMDDEGWDG